MPRSMLEDFRETLSAEPPLQRLWRRGGSALSDLELVSVLLRPEGSETAAREIAQEVLGNHGLAGLLRLRETSLGARQVGPRHVSPLLAAVELGRRLARLRIPRRHLMKQPEAVASYLWMRYQTYDQEVAGVLYLDVHNRLIEEREVARGCLSRTYAEPRQFLRPALECGASAMIVFHTHPSGDPAPSAADLAVTRQLREAAEILGIALLDHLILGSGRQFVSLQKRGAW